MFKLKKLTKIILIFSLIFLNLMPLGIFAISSDAQSALDSLESIKKTAGLQSTDPIGVLVNIVNYLLTLIGVIFLILIIYGGYLWMTSGGSEEKTKKGKELLKAALIGLIIIVLARVIYQFVIDWLRGAEMPVGGEDIGGN